MSALTKLFPPRFHIIGRKSIYLLFPYNFSIFPFIARLPLFKYLRFLVVPTRTTTITRVASLPKGVKITLKETKVFEKVEKYNQIQLIYWICRFNTSANWFRYRNDERALNRPIKPRISYVTYVLPWTTERRTPNVSPFFRIQYRSNAMWLFLHKFHMQISHSCT